MAPTLPELASMSEQLRLSDGLGARPSLSTTLAAALDGTHPWFALNDALMEGMALRATADRDSGSDARQSPFWPLLAHQQVYLRAFEDGRVVKLEQVTLAAVEQALRVANRLEWDGWACWVGPLEEVTLDYGESSMARPVHLVHVDGRTFKFRSRSPGVVREVFERFTGCRCLPGRPGHGDRQGAGAGAQASRRPTRAQRRRAGRDGLAPFGKSTWAWAANDGSGDFVGDGS